MWKDRNLDRHGHDEAEQTERKLQRHLREISMWYELRDDKALQLSEAEKKIFHSTFQEHKHKEGTARLAEMRLCSFCSVLQQCHRLGKARQKAERDNTIGESSSSSEDFNNLSPDGESRGSVSAGEEPDLID